MGKINIQRFKSEILHLKSVGLDSMCFIYQFTKHESYFPLTDCIISLLEKNMITAFTSMVTVVEIFVHEEKISDQMTIRAYEQVLLSLPNTEIVPITWDVARLASKLRAKYAVIKTPDALQLAATILKGGHGFVTNDSKLTQVKELKVITFNDYI